MWYTILDMLISRRRKLDIQILKNLVAFIIEVSINLPVSESTLILIRLNINICTFTLVY